MMQKSVPMVLVFFTIIGCQVDTTTGGLNSQYGIFFNQADHIKELLAKNRIQQASDVYSKNESFFSGKGKTHLSLLEKLRNRVETLVRHDLGTVAEKANSQVWPVNRKNWSGVALVLTNLEDSLNTARRNKILSHEWLSPSIQNGENIFEGLQKKLKASANAEFQRYDLINDVNFQNVYPIKINLNQLFLKNKKSILSDVKNLNLREIKLLKDKYESTIPKTIKLELSYSYFWKAHANFFEGEKQNIKALIKAIEISKKNGFVIEQIDTARIKAVDITSKTLSNSEQISFPIKLIPDLPIKVLTIDLDQAITKHSQVDTEILVLIDIAAAKVDREILAYDPVSSEFQIGTQSHQNPEYAGAQNGVTQAQMALQDMNMRVNNVNNQYCQGAGCIGKAVAQIAVAAMRGKAQKKLNEAMSNLQNTPMMVEKPVYKSYQFRKASIESSKISVVNYYVIDKNEGKYVKGTFDAKQTQSFTVPYNLKSNDRHKSSHLSGLDTEQNIKDFEERSFDVSLTNIIKEYFNSKTPPVNLADLYSLREGILKDKNIAIARFQADRIMASNESEHDDLARSVVVIHSLQGKIGTGFYVNDDLVLTNYHVVEDSQYVEMTLRNGTETFGKIIAKDIRLDLALISVQTRGEPVKFHNGNGIKIGSTTFAIGHPNGLEFSVTRGIVSAIRAHKNVNFSGGKKVYFIQTDTPLNKGNSGGPLFLDGAVVGVNDWGLSKQISEGLNFAIHVKEVLKFLRKQNINVKIRAAV